MNSILKKLEGGLIVSCQALEEEPLHGSTIMSKMAIAAREGGAVGIRANSPADIKAIKQAVDLPVIGLYKKNYQDSEIYITPTIKEVGEVVAAGADIVAFDATFRVRPGGQQLDDFVKEIKSAFPSTLLMADIATVEEGLHAVELGCDVISTTLAGYTPDTEHITKFDRDLLATLVEKAGRPVVAEGRVNTPELAAECIRAGAFAVVVGSAITRPQEITKHFAKEISLTKMKGFTK
ncbi:N-acetylmannosamine-6-phosphate 2-epimerase [Bacillus sp. FJAT-18017]|uniref:N-acetylmannosamine-6-phosphate 2-epimerase n=1 Tax=Bacillus sp. FJAT-18017 TaxID=1705566 RepID=UPI0006AE3934|nr:N-acetylmannosamine-6-phosphate 2-epimerase [Bacillus sp. FJAT-18017]ALC89324.1 N-acetylmannosamine-6-phosphate 2-epimerase [Bacillus sp. FJAT-18017]